LIMISYRYLPIFPQEAELNPLETETDASPEANVAETDEDVSEPALTPAEA